MFRFKNSTFRINVELNKKNYKKLNLFQMTNGDKSLVFICYMIDIHYSNNIYCPAILGLKVKRKENTSNIKHENEDFLVKLALFYLPHTVKFSHEKVLISL